MVHIDFYEKPGCSNNTRQKRILEAAGHTVVAHNLLTIPWSRDELRKFFAGLPVAAWFNRNAPAIRNGVVDPDALGEEEALRLMLIEPLLIRRPLLRVGNERRVGFDLAILEDWIGITVRDKEDPESCARDHRLREACG